LSISLRSVMSFPSARHSMGTKPNVEIQYLRTRDDDSSKLPIKTQRPFVAEIPAGAETKVREPQQSPSAQNRKIGSDCSFQATEALGNCSFNDRTVITLSFIRCLLSFLLRFYPLPPELDESCAFLSPLKEFPK